ncbi:zinc finger protein 407 [Ictalurus furcatus]|uniref:zinc finger protein 407 n=1 Tax=Ictalurus furcatus TaxID=66913 RepID=UPI002350CD69|nr:zinc finger protein 407 [Ictalurus furcatus]XP_053507511.1 zinc finger protein 407 [Ictalurus furcatus]XP_053507513.1 zinc finger protein 407 [Ictalurus furcatus]
MDCPKRKLRSGKETCEERPENKDERALPDCAIDNGENEGTSSQCERVHTASVASSEENNGRACRECDFVAKTPTALKIHCRRKHNSLHAEAMGTTDAEETRTVENVAEELPAKDQVKSTVPPIDQLSTDAPPIDQLSANELPIDQLSSGVPPIDQLSTNELPIDHLNTDTLPIDQLCTGVPPIDQLGSGVPPVDHLGTGVPPVDQLNTGVPPVDQLNTGVPPVDQLNTGVPPVDQLNTGVPPVDQLGCGVPPVDQLNTGVLSVDQLGSGVPPVDQLGSGVPPVDQLGSVVPPVDQLSSGVPPVDQLGTAVPPVDQLGSGAQRFERLYCRCCSFYTCTAEEMSAHLSDESHRNLAMEKNIGPLFEQCVEKVLVILSDEQKRRDGESEHDEGISEDISEDVRETESAEHTLAELLEANAPHKRKRGRPKSSQVMSCSHCGLVASNPTNLSVHIRRKHSRLYSFHCKLCNYSCVTKGDMDRHCETKKHIKRVQSDGNGQEAVIMLNAEQPAHSGEAGPTEKSHNAPNATQQETPNDADTAGETEGTGSDVPCKKPKYDSAYSCDHCYFVAHSALSLALHVRRKHTRDFEFVCLACSYYAVTRREMSRHTATEKHKLKRQRYLQKRHNTHQHDNTVDKHNENTSQLAENTNRQSDSTDNNIEDAHQNPDNLHQHTETKPQLCDNTQQNNKTLHQNIDPEPEPDSGGNDDLNNDAGNAAAAVKGSAGEKELNINPQMKSSEDTNAPQDSLEFPDPSNTEEGEEEYNNNDDDDDDDDYNNDDEEEDEEEEDVCETTAESPSSEKRVFRATAFDECVFSLKAPTDGPCDEDDGESYKSLHQASKMLKMSEGHEVSTRVRCDDCGFLAEGLSGLNVHITMKHSSKEKHFHCLLCGKSFHSDSSLQQHLSSSAHLRTERGSVDERPDGGAAFRCVRCNEPCNSEQELFVHIKEKHEELLREVNKYVMEDTEQINREREENPGNVCKYCGKVCKSSNSMAFLAHVRTHTGSKPFMCKICNFATAQLGDARNHVKRHLGMREYKCHLCGWAFVMKKHLNTHLLGKHGLGQPKERKYDCELCERSFSEKWALNNHMKLHTGDKPFKCPWSSCHYAFLTHSAMKDHYRTHTGEKSFLCDLCGFAGGTRHALTKHRRQHTGERPFRCDLCSFASTTQSHLTRHKRVHTGEKPYRCPWCDYRSNCAENIRKHILHTGKHEGVMMYNCPRCDFCTNSPSEFRNHLKDKHRDIENPDLAYLHAGIVSKSFECRLKGQGSSFVEADAPFTPEEGRLGAETLQQVIIIQGYREEAELQGTEMEEAELEESAAATLQTLAMSSVNGELLQVTQDGCIIPYTHKNYVLVESSGSLERVEQTSHETNQDRATAPSTALDALLCAVSEIDQQDGAAQQDVRTTTEQQAHAQGEGQEAVQVYGEVVQVLGHAHEEVLQFAASQLMMREGLTQVIVNDEGTHYIVTEVSDSSEYAQGEGAESGQEVGLVDDAGNQTSEAPVTYEPVSLKQQAQE